MALFKKVIKDNGITTEYHKVSYVSIAQEHNVNFLNLTVKLTSYMDEDYRQNEQPIENQMYYFDITNEEEQSMSARKLAYMKLKTLEQWSDAVDC